jgi:hypothetical protein
MDLITRFSALLHKRVMRIGVWEQQVEDKRETLGLEKSFTSTLLFLKVEETFGGLSKYVLFITLTENADVISNV